jgi:predicted nucleotidyltransferase
MTSKAPQADALLECARSATEWQRRLEEDTARALEPHGHALADPIATVVSRARKLGAKGLLLTGSTARERRTETSDLDFLVVGPRPSVDDLAEEVDLRALSPDEFGRRVLEGDEYVQWALRFGCVLHDSGVLREAAHAISVRGIWPEPERKRKHARTLLELAARILPSGDRDASEEAMRAALTAVAHWILLSNRIFPLSRKEIPDQILELGSFDLATALHRTIHGEPELDELAVDLHLGRHALGLTPDDARNVKLEARQAGPQHA